MAALYLAVMRPRKKRQEKEGEYLTRHRTERYTKGMEHKSKIQSNNARVHTPFGWRHGATTLELIRPFILRMGYQRETYAPHQQG